MKDVKTTCDSTCDLTKALNESYGVEVIPMGAGPGNDFRHDGADVTARDLFDYVDKSGKLPKTSVIPMGEYDESYPGWM